ncbi:NAD(P)-dependent oxidoreductase [Pseudomaricurvus sp. HS19]|uniref:NAD(P)-dependent oxidoreductase n=1 Tax=Pseudomaricurvus sp. HS19 TaxID=2692626 RepID=UPI00136E0DD1|nr:NAD(P)-dependent oxidoreductase [Pseudomaricurvus sp. HS19]MYM62082.1 NAD-binding protein [Pseudomaricurvus sp. HS19]
MPDSSPLPRPALGFIGLGLMGTPMTRNLLRGGYAVHGWARSPQKLRHLMSEGLELHEDIGELVAHCDIIMLCVSDTDAVREVVFAPGGIADHARPGQLLVDFSSIAPEATREMAAQLQQDCGCDWVDAPVSGGVAGAENASLVIMAGGRTEALTQLQPVFSHLSQRVTHMGDTGTGQATKVCNQMLVSCNLLVMAEVIALAEQAGVDATRLPQALQGGFADSLPLQITGPRMAARDLDEVRWHVRTLLKDLTLAQQLAASSQSDTPMSDLARTLMQAHADAGYRDRDPATLIEAYSHNPGSQS